jgi:hypothetical protein
MSIDIREVKIWFLDLLVDSSVDGRRGHGRHKNKRKNIERKDGEGRLTKLYRGL